MASFTSKRRWKPQCGYTLVEILTSLAIASTGALGMGSLILHIQDSARSLQISTTRSELNFMIRRLLLNRNSLKETLLRNPPMKVAVTAATADYAQVGGVLYTDNRAYPVGLFDNQGQRMVGAGADDTGSPETPVYYTIEGAICSTPGFDNCLIATTAVVRIQGLAMWGSPDNMFPAPAYPYPAWHASFKPEFMTVSYTIKFMADHKGVTIAKKPFTGTVFLAVDDIGNLVP